MEEINTFKKNAYLSIGSNIGDRLENIKKACRLINSEVGTIIEISSVYENPPIGFESNDLFYNICLNVSTTLNPIQILEATQKIETEVGRTEKTSGSTYSSRIIDIDIVLVDDVIFESPTLVIPHPLFSTRNFVLLPLTEIAECVVDPIQGISINQLLLKSNDKSELFIVYPPILID